jgi:hypothetical protein
MPMHKLKWNLKGDVQKPKKTQKGEKRNRIW